MPLPWKTSASIGYLDGSSVITYYLWPQIQGFLSKFKDFRINIALLFCYEMVELLQNNAWRFTKIWDFESLLFTKPIFQP